MDRKELKKANGDVFFEAWRMPEELFIRVNWIGIQTLETVVMGGNQLLAMLREKPCRGILNSNRELIGPWESAVPYMAYKWAPTAEILGLKYFAHVLSPGIFGQRSYEVFNQQLKGQLRTRAFEMEDQAMEWLNRHLD
ncbi:hypothetical protein [Rufibacter tibetensis]|nr:hypothetical protein [Rufibacter tibetensis]